MSKQRSVNDKKIVVHTSAINSESLPGGRKDAKAINAVRIIFSRILIKACRVKSTYTNNGRAEANSFSIKNSSKPINGNPKTASSMIRKLGNS